MESSRILDFFNLKLDIFIVFVCTIFVVMLITLFFLLLDYLKMRKRYNEFMKGENVQSLEYTIYKRFRQIDQLQLDQKDNDDQISIIYDLVRKSYSKIGIYRYDAFQIDNGINGGSLSFCLTMLNSKNDGFILNTIHNRAGCHVYMKEVRAGAVDLTLADEEQKSLELALNYGSEDAKLVDSQVEKNKSKILARKEV